ncbi:MAG: histidinol-phosphate transaminase [Cyclobacteriaceae bacterium]
MKFDLNKIVRKSLKGIRPYSTARDDFKGTASVYLDANENPFDTSYNRYPDPQQQPLKAAIANIKGVTPEKIILGNGSDEVIDLLFRAFCEPATDNVIIPQPTYGMYSVYANVNDVSTKSPSLTETFDLDVDLIIKDIDANTKLVFLCSPNNPSGNLLTEEKVKLILKSFNGLVVVDEAYIDFAKTDGFLPFLDQYPNLVVVQTLSKAWGLAGLRLGIGFASEEIIQVLSQIKPPYNISSVAQKIALEALGNSEAKEKWVTTLMTQREILTTKLLAFSFIKKVYRSDANFLLVKVDDAAHCYSYLTKRGIIVRDRSSSRHCDNCLRISVGTPDENKILIDTLTEYEKSTVYRS